MNQDFPEADWKQFKKLLPAAADRFCKAILQEVKAVASDEARESFDRIEELRTLMTERGFVLRDLFSDLRRSNARWRLSAMYRDGMITEEEIMRFSEQTRERVAQSMMPLE